MICDRCLGVIERGRAFAGMTTCRECGDIQARRAIADKANQVGPAFNKGGYQFLGGASLKQNVLDAGRKTGVSAEEILSVGAERRKTCVAKARRKRVGLYWVPSGDCYVWYEGDDPDAMGATKKALL